MSAIASRLAATRASQSAFRGSQTTFRARTRAASSEATPPTEAAEAEGGEKPTLKKAAKKDPELYILGAIMSGAFLLVGWHFGTKPTASVSETATSMAEDTMPWQAESHTGDYKYQYHPGGDTRKPLKNAPSALHATIYPPLTLRKSEHDRVNRYGKDDWKQ